MTKTKMDDNQDIVYTGAEAARIAAEYRAGQWLNREDEKGALGFWDLAGELATYDMPDTFDTEQQEEQATEIENRQTLIYTALVAAAEIKQ